MPASLAPVAVGLHTQLSFSGTTEFPPWQGVVSVRRVDDPGGSVSKDVHGPVTLAGEGDEIWDLDVDVVAVGGGAAGYAAAVAAAGAGARVVLLEGSALTGGTTAKSLGATFWIPNNHLMRAKGIADPKPEALQYMSRLAHPAAYNASRPHLGLRERDFALIETFYDAGPDAIGGLEKLGAIDPWLVADIPDYHSQLPEDVAPYGRHLRSGGPVGVSVPADEHKLLAGLRHAADRLGVRTLVNHRVVGIVLDADRQVLGVEVHAARSTLLVRARGGVVFGTGGFTHDPDLVADHLRGPIVGGCAHDTSVGDLLHLTAGLGVRLGNMANAWWGEAPVELALRHRATETDMFMPFGDSMMFVNSRGRRVMSEKLPYAERARAHFRWDPVDACYPDLLLFMVYDDHVAQHPQLTDWRWPLPPAGETRDYVLSGRTWEELASRLGERVEALQLPGAGPADGFADRLRETVARFDGFAVSGVDLDFGRGTRDLEQAWMQPTDALGSGRPNPTMRPFDREGPYHAVIIGPSALDTKGGPQTDPEARILDLDRNPVPGLYGAGNCVASPAGEAYWAAGATIGLALTYGWIAGRGAAARGRPR
jgi:3-oxosteroid 1-dehydrogenase